MKLFIIIVSFNGGETLVRLINSLIKDSAAKIVVVENGDAESRITNHESRITVIKNKKNLGFAKGANIGIKYTLEKGADRILLLNQDVVVEREFIPVLIHNSADIVSPVIKFKRNDKWVYDYGGKIDWNIGRTWHIELPDSPSRSHFVTPGRWPNGLLPGGSEEIDYVSGCCMLIKKQVFKKIGLLDERFFLYFEDVDFCLRAKRAGFTISVEEKSLIIHQLIEGEKRSFFKKYHLLRSNFIFINKYLGIRRILGYLYLSALAIKMVL